MESVIKILIEEHKKYKRNNYCFNLHQSIIDRTKSYLEMSCQIVEWFKNEYTCTDNVKDILKIKDIFDNFSTSDYYANLSKVDKRKYNKTYFSNYLSTNIFFRDYYFARSNGIRNVIKKWIPNTNDDNEDDTDNDNREIKSKEPIKKVTKIKKLV